jgi:uridine kinase
MKLSKKHKAAIKSYLRAVAASGLTVALAIAGDSGVGKDTLTNNLIEVFGDEGTSIIYGDNYHRFERDSLKWRAYTHLNPEANLITKMNSDIFDLKIGKEIFHVDYDHSTGKFTDKQTIEPADNIIVCGLHSLYTNDDNVYDLKIYIDTSVFFILIINKYW